MTQNNDIFPLAFIDLKKQRERIGDKIDAGVMAVMEHGQYIMGPEVKQLETDLESYCGVKHAITCSNGTDAIALALRALDIKAGDVIFVPSFTFAATAEVVAWFGATPMFVDVLPDTFNMDPKSLETGIAKAKAEGLNARGVMTVDLFGLPADYEKIESICNANNLWLVADSAQGFGCVDKGRTSGQIGTITTTSFFPAKPLGCYGDGGAVFTNDDTLAEVMRSIRVHGKGNDKYDNVRIGMNARLDTMQAAVLIEKLKIYNDEIIARNSVADMYAARLHNIVATPSVADDQTCVWAQYTLTLPENVDRAEFAATLKEKNIPTAVYYPKPLHQQTAYKHYPSASATLPVCDDLANRVISLPMHPYLSDEQINYICDVVIESLEGRASAAA